MVTNIKDEEQTLTNAKNLAESLKDVPEVKDACQWSVTNPEEFGEIFETYLRLVRKLEGYTDEDIAIVRNANKIMKKRKVRATSASNLRADAFLRNLSEDQKNSLVDTVSQAFNPKSPFYEDSMSQLASMMFEGHKMFVSGGTPKDGDPTSDRVIWGHTQAREDVEPIVLVHFIICHYLARFVSHALNDVVDVQDKDAFLAVLTDVILLEEAKNPGSTGVLKIWLTPRDRGGLGWMIQEQIDAYGDAIVHGKSKE